MKPAIRQYEAWRPGDGYTIIVQVPATFINMGDDQRNLIAHRLRTSFELLLTHAMLEGK